MFGTLGYVALGFTLLEALYQTVTTVATVGFREVRPLDSAGKIFTMVLIVVGVGTVLYNLGVLVEAVTEGHLRQTPGEAPDGQADRRPARPRDHLRLRPRRRLGG